NPLVVLDDVLDERLFEVQAGIAKHPARLAELQHQRLRGLVDDEHRAQRDDAAEHEDDRERGQEAAAHGRRPLDVAGGAAGGGVASRGGGENPGRLGSGRYGRTPLWPSVALSMMTLLLL